MDGDLYIHIAEKFYLQLLEVTSFVIVLDDNKFLFLNYIPRVAAGLTGEYFVMM